MTVKYTHASLSFLQACFTRKMAIASSLLQAVKKCRQACPPEIFMGFSQGSIPESLVEKKIKIDKAIQRLVSTNNYMMALELKFCQE